MMKKFDLKDSTDKAVNQFITPKQISLAEEKSDTEKNLLVQNHVSTQNKRKDKKNDKEMKTKRFNLLLLPSLLDNLKKIAYVLKISLNEAVNLAIEFYCNANKDLIKQYAQIEKLTMPHETDK